MVHMHRVIMSFPSLFRNWVLNDFSKRATFSFSFVHGPKRPVTVATSKSISQAFLGVAMCTMSGSFTVFCHNKKVKLGISADAAAMKDPQDFMEIVYRNLDEVCGRNWRDQV